MLNTFLVQLFLVTSLLSLAYVDTVTGQTCLRANKRNEDFAEPPFIDSNAASLRANPAVQAIVPTYRFLCNCVIITSWETYVHPGEDDHVEDMAYDITFQVWRPSADVNNTGCYSLVGKNVFRRFSFREGGFVRLDPPVNEVITAQSGDVVGYYTNSREGNDDGIQLEIDRDYDQNEVWYRRGSGEPDTSGECPFPVGDSGGRVLTSSTNAAPMLRVVSTIVSCPTLSTQLTPTPSVSSTEIPPSSSRHFLTPSSPYTLIVEQSLLISPDTTPPSSIVILTNPNSSDTTNGKVLIGTVLAVIIVIVAVVAMIIILLLAIKLRTKGSNMKERIASNETNLSNPCYESASLTVVNAKTKNAAFSSTVKMIYSRSCCHRSMPYDDIHKRKEVVYDVPQNGTTEYEMIVDDIVDVSGNFTPKPYNNGVIGNALYHDIGPNTGLKPLQKEISNQSLMKSTKSESLTDYEVCYEDVSTVQGKDLYNKLQFGREEEDYWVPASTAAALYSQLSSKKYREIQRRQISGHSLVGSGQFGDVYKATWSVDQTELQLAVKTLKSEASDDDRIKFLQEAAIMGQFTHPNVVKMYGVITIGEPTTICMEFLETGDLRRFLQVLNIAGSCYDDFRDTQLMFLKFARNIASGMDYLSRKCFVHRDLAARNILLDKSNTCKIADFDMARDLMDDTYYTASGGKIPIKWTAPEALLYKKYSTDSDVWSYGMVLFEIWSVGKKPFSNITNAQVMRLLEKGFCQAPPPGCPRAIYEVMVKCWNPDHQSRPSFRTINQEYLKKPCSMLLRWSTDDNGLSPAVGVCGAPLEEAQRLHFDLQIIYTSSNNF